MAFKSNPADAVKSSIAFQQSLGRAKSIQGALNVKKKRQTLKASNKALIDDNLEAWTQVNKRKRIIATPMSRLKKCASSVKRAQNSLPKPYDDGDGDGGSKRKNNKKRKIDNGKLKSIHDNLNKMQLAVEETIKGVAPIAMELKKCYEKQKLIEERMEELTRQGSELDRALMRACQSVFNNEPSWLYANEDFVNQIIPSSMYHQRNWVKNKREEKKRNASGSQGPGNTMKGNTAGNLRSKKPSGKMEINAKKLANKERQDMPDTISEHIPIAVSDPDSYSGLVGSMRHQKKNKGYIKRT